MAGLVRLWAASVMSLGGRRDDALATGDELEQSYAEAHRRYHTASHIIATHRAASDLAEAGGLGPEDRARLTLAVCGHDVIYRGIPGEDEAASAAWSRGQLARCDLSVIDRDRVSTAILATAGHLGPAGDALCDCLLDADLSILAADQAVYDGYLSGVRAEYSHVKDDAWRAGRRAVLESFLGRTPLFRTAEGQRRWESAARRNMEVELAGLILSPPPGLERAGGGPGQHTAAWGDDGQPSWSP